MRSLYILSRPEKKQSRIVHIAMTWVRNYKQSAREYWKPNGLYECDILHPQSTKPLNLFSHQPNTIRTSTVNHGPACTKVNLEKSGEESRDSGKVHFVVSVMCNEGLSDG